jgi:hypothetical protein
MMKHIIFSAMVMTSMGCGKKFEPDLRGWKAYTLPGRPMVHLDLDGREKTIKLPGGDGVVYRYPQWTKLHDNLLLVQIVKTRQCYDYQIISADTTGEITDTIYTAPANTALNFKLAPNDSILILKTYPDDCEEEIEDFSYTFYNRHLKKSLPDTVTVEHARGLHFTETVWSPNSQKVIISEWQWENVKASAYNVVTKDTTYIGEGNNFTWSPADNNLVAYIKGYSIYFKNIETGEEEVIFEGREKRRASRFRFNPTGDFLMIHVSDYLLNVDVPPLQSTKIIYFSIRDKIESRTFFEDQRIDTWKDGPSANEIVTREAGDTLN